MNALPIARRELLVLARRPWVYWSRLGVGGLVAGISALTIFLAATGGLGNPASLGRPLFDVLLFLAGPLCLCAGPVLVADSLANERQAGTLGLLFLANLRSPDILAGKLIALSLPALQALLAIVPVMGVAFFLGGVTGGEFARTMVALLSLLGWSLAVALVCSTLLREGRAAFGLSLALGVGAMALPLLTRGWTLAGTLVAFPAEFLGAPGTALYHAREVEKNASLAVTWWAAVGWTQVMTLGCLAVASVALAWNWRDERRPVPPPASRTARRRRCSESDPLQWLARERLGGRAWVRGYTLAAMGLMCWLASGAPGWTATPWQVLGLVWLAQAGFKLTVAWYASRALGPERASGSLEVLLVTPLGGETLWRSWLRAMRGLFLVPAMLFCGWNLALAWRLVREVSGPEETLGFWLFALLAAALFLLDGYTLTWVGLWEGLTARNASRACARTLLRVLVAPSLVSLPITLLAVWGGAPWPDGLVLIGSLWLGLGFLTDLAVGAWTMVRVSDDFRAAAITANQRRSLG